MPDGAFGRSSAHYEYLFDPIHGVGVIGTQLVGNAVEHRPVVTYGHVKGGIILAEIDLHRVPYLFLRPNFGVRQSQRGRHAEHKECYLLHVTIAKMFLYVAADKGRQREAHGARAPTAEDPSTGKASKAKRRQAAPARPAPGNHSTSHIRLARRSPVKRMGTPRRPKPYRPRPSRHGGTGRARKKLTQAPGGNGGGGT